MEKARLDPDLVQSFVGLAHGDFAKVKQLLEQEPQLLNAAWDWGGGDFETALEAAGHVGNQDIARFLIEKGARVNIFQAAMLGDLELVKAFLAAHPASLNALGPHGIPLVAHAKAGGPDNPVIEFLEAFTRPDGPDES